MTQPTTDTAPRRQVLKIRAGRLSFTLSLQEFFGNTEPYKTHLAFLHNFIYVAESNWKLSCAWSCTLSLTFFASCNRLNASATSRFFRSTSLSLSRLRNRSKRLSQISLVLADIPEITNARNAAKAQNISESLVLQQTSASLEQRQNTNKPKVYKLMLQQEELKRCSIACRRERCFHAAIALTVWTAGELAYTTERVHVKNVRVHVQAND